MKFLPAVDLWNPALAAAVRTGQLRLQTGQWVRCGSNRLSRFVRSTRTSVWAVHPEGEKGVTVERFKTACHAWLDRPKKHRNPEKVCQSQQP